MFVKISFYFNLHLIIIMDLSMKKLIIVLSAIITAPIITSCSSPDNNTNNIPNNVVNFSGVDNVSFKLDDYAITAGQTWQGINNTQACEVDLNSSESKDSNTKEPCSSLIVKAQVTSGDDVINYLSSHQINLINDADNQANFAFSGTLNFSFNNTPVSCDGLFISQSTIDNESVWAIYDTFGNSIAPEYTDQETVTLECKNGAKLTLSGDDLPDNLAYGNSFEVVDYTPSPN